MRMSQILTVPSSLPLASHLFSVFHAMHVTFEVCPLNVTNCTPVASVSS